LNTTAENWKKNFLFIWTGQLFSILSSSIVSFAIIFWLSVKSGSAEVLAFATIATLLPQLVLGLFSGVLVDRWNRKKTMIISDLYIAGLTAIMAVLFWYGDVDKELIYILLALRSAGSAFHAPAMEASVPLLAPKNELMRIAGVNNMIFSVSTIASPALAAFFIMHLNMTWVLITDVIGALIACGTLLFVKIPDPWDSKEISDGPDKERFRNGMNKKNNEFSRFFQELGEGVREIIVRPGLKWMLIFTVFAALAMVPVSTLFPLMTLDHFLGDTAKMSTVEVAWGIGMLAGGGIMSHKKFKFNTVMLINAMYVILGITFFVSGFLPVQAFYLFVSLTFIGGIAGAVFWGSFTVLLQTNLDSSVLGRVLSIHNSLIMIPAMFSLIATGYLADKIGITNTFILGGAMLMLIGLVSPLIPSIRLLHGKY
jgi:DHA3 family macrolide efflux protein-like MFS transporter